MNDTDEGLLHRARNALVIALAEGKAFLDPASGADGWLIDRLENARTSEELVEDAARLGDVLERKQEYITALKIRNARHLFAETAGVGEYR